MKIKRILTQMQFETRVQTTNPMVEKDRPHCTERSLSLVTGNDRAATSRI